MTTIVLSPARGNRYLSADLCGKPVWQRTVDAALASKPQRVVWAGTGGPRSIESIAESRLTSIRGAVLLLPAELACITASSLKRLIQASRKAPAALFRGVGGAPVVLAMHASALKALRPRSAADLMRRTSPAPVLADDRELVAIDSASAWSDAHRVLRERTVSSLMRRGVLVPDPASVLVDPEASVGKGALLSPWVVLEGATKVGASCRIGSFSHLVNVTLGANTTVLDHCFLRDSRIGREASIGPFVHIRPDSDVGDRARVGNFVELKKSKLGAGAKAPHLSYVGDAQIGRDANIGAGTITCNYDGRVKNRTVVGDGAFIGSDVQLVAPVRVGKGAFVAAGSCIVKDVPAHSLALARSRQVIKKNWARDRKRG